MQSLDVVSYNAVIVLDECLADSIHCNKTHQREPENIEMTQHTVRLVRIVPRKHYALVCLMHQVTKQWPLNGR